MAKHVQLGDEILLPLQEPFSVIESVPLGDINADEINSINVVSGIQHIDRQVFILGNQGLSPSIEPSSIRKPIASQKAPPFILPQLDIPFFTGRKDELKQLEHLLLNSSGSRLAGIVGLTGTGGMGKSALAFHFATLYRDRFPDGVIGLNVNSRQLDTLAQRFAYLAGVEIDLQQGLTTTEIMQLVFRHKQALLIFDNAEEAAVLALHPGGDRCAVIVTTRNRGLLRNFGIPTNAQIDVQHFSYLETENLLRQLLGESRINAEPEAVKKLYELLGGLPLALRIVGSMLAEQPFTLTRYAEILRDEKERLYLHDPDDPQLDVHASFSLSLKFLDDEQKTLFACLGACTSEGFTIQTAQAVSQQDEIVVGRGLGRLLRLSLLNEATQEGRYVLHPLLFLFSRNLAKEYNLLVQAEQLYTEYFTIFAEKHYSLSFMNLHALDEELDALLLTARRLTNDLPIGTKFYLLIEPFLQARGYWSQALELIDSLLYVARANKDFSYITQYLLQQGQFLGLLGKLSDAETVLLEGRNTANHIDNIRQQQRSLAMVLNSLGGVYQRQGKFDEAVDALQQSYALSKELGDERGQAMVLNSLGGVYQRQGKFDEAVDALQQSYALSKELGDQISLAMVLNSLGGVYQRQGKFDEAVDAFKQSLVLGKDINTHKAMVLNSWGRALLEHGQAQEASEKLKASFEIDERLRKAQGMRIITPSLVRALTTIGRNLEAQQYCLRALAVAPNDRRLLKLQEQLFQPHQVSLQTTFKTGQIKRLLRNLAGYRYGFITPDDNSESIYFGENQVDALLLPQLAENLYVSVEVEVSVRGPRAVRVWISSQ